MYNKRKAHDYSSRMYPHYSGNSYKRDNMGRYSRNNGMSYRNNMNSYGGDYSRNGDMYNRLETMMHEASTDREREAIRRAMEQL